MRIVDLVLQLTPISSIESDPAQNLYLIIQTTVNANDDEALLIIVTSKFFGVLQSSLVSMQAASTFGEGDITFFVFMESEAWMPMHAF